MSTVVNWGDSDGRKSRKGGGGNDFLRLTHGEEYHIRCAGKPVKFYRYYVDAPAGADKKFYSAITSDPDECVIRNVYNQEPSTRYAINVFDRSDGALRILEMAPTVFNQISEWAEANEVSPGGPDGCDFRIRVTREKANDARTTRYNITSLKQTSFSDAEKEFLKDKGAGLHPLMDIFKAVPQDKIEETLGYKKAEEASTAPVASGSSSSDDDDFAF